MATSFLAAVPHFCSLESTSCGSAVPACQVILFEPSRGTCTCNCYFFCSDISRERGDSIDLAEDARDRVLAPIARHADFEFSCLEREDT